jgi:hypothetical protein
MYDKDHVVEFIFTQWILFSHRMLLSDENLRNTPFRNNLKHRLEAIFLQSSRLLNQS